MSVSTVSRITNKSITTPGAPSRGGRMRRAGRSDYPNRDAARQGLDILGRHRLAGDPKSPLATSR